MLVAEGIADVMFEPVLAIWDVAALVPIVEEAGGRLTDRRGIRHADGGNAVTTNGLVHDAVLGLVREDAWDPGGEEL
jgi:histidinol-phosphatase